LRKDPAAPHHSQARGGPLRRGRAGLLGFRINEDDVDAAERAVLAAGATRLPNEHEGGFRVFADPAGHPFCLVTASPRAG
jgi:hypothetical protein